MNAPEVGTWCFACLPDKGPEAVKIRQDRASACLVRQEHNPAGPTIPHEHAHVLVQTCQDCGTLVVAAEYGKGQDNGKRSH